ncbi:hypothetical protein CerSpe_030910 [Prunus speciosa]
MPSASETLLLITIFLLLPLHAVSSAIHAGHAIPINGLCRDTCGTIPVKFPFGTGFGCGHPDFVRYIKCSSGTLQFSTGTGGFSLDRASPFTIREENIFVLLGCSTTSPVFDPNEDLCDTGSGSRVCRGLYSCKGVAGIGLQQNAPISTCCVYDSQVGVGSGYALVLPKLQCSSYTSIYEFGDEGDPMKWKFGISLQYNDSYYTNACKDCEASEGLCGFSGLDQSFACVCQNGVNTTRSCFEQGYALSGAVELEVQIKTIIGGLLVSWMLLQTRSR